MAKYKMPAMLPLCLAVLVSQNAMALGLGPASLDSELGEPLFARIPIFRADGLGSEQLLVTLGAVKDGDSGVEIGSVDTRSITAVGEIDLSGKGTIYLRSNRPLVEPFLHFMLTVRWPNGSLSRAYTLLFDPPLNAPATSSSSVASLQNVESSPSSAIVNRSAPRQVRAAPSTAAITAESVFYTTVRGDSLWSIGLRLAKVKSGSATLWMERLYANNPTAFIRGNRNLLKERMTLDLFESIPEPLDTDPAVMPAVKAQPQKTELVATSSLGRPNEKSVPAGAISNRKEENADSQSDIGSSPSDSDGALTEQQFLQQSLSRVNSEVDRVSENITVMTERLIALQDQLASLNSQYGQLQSRGLEASKAKSLGEFDLDGESNEQSEDELALAGPAAFAQTAVVPAPTPDEPNVPVDADASTPAKNDSAVRAQSNEPFMNWRWLLPLAGLGVGLLLWLRRRRENAEAAFNVDFSHVNAAGAAQVSSNDTFGEVFSSLDTQANVVLTPSAKPTDSEPSHTGNDKTVFDLPAAAKRTLPQSERATAKRDAELLSTLNISPNKVSEATDENVNLEPSAVKEHEVKNTDVKAANIDVSAVKENAAIDEIELDDDFFANLVVDPDPDPDLDSAASLVADFDLSATNEDWLTDSVDRELDHSNDASDNGDASDRAAAALELGDFAGAKQLLEMAISDNDDIELKMQLMDVLARSGDNEAFEAMAIQLEFAEIDNDVMREVDSLRNLLHNDNQGNGTRRAD